MRWKFTPGEVLHYQMEQKTTTQVKLAATNQDVKTTVSQIVDTTWTVLSVDAAGNAEMSQSIDRMRSKVESNFGTFDFDSQSDKKPEGVVGGPLVPILKALIGQKFKYKITPLGELSDIQVPDALLKTLEESGPAAGGAVHQGRAQEHDSGVELGASWRERRQALDAQKESSDGTAR